MSWWMWLLIVVAALVVLSILVNLPSVFRYWKIKQM
jgi:Sec-independent protein translocase protein TatA